MKPISIEPQPAAPATGFALFALGFRPFFLLAGVAGIGLMMIWIAYLAHADLPGFHYYGPIVWHSHEMLFGYAGAVIAGFLLTATRNWTGLNTARGGALAGLAGIWLLGRLAPWVSDGWVVAVLDVAFLPALALTLAVPLLRSGQRHNYLFLPLLAAMVVANCLVHAEALGLTGSARTGTQLMINLTSLLIVIMGGRVIPFFTEGALRGFKARTGRGVDQAAVASVIVLLVAELFGAPMAVTAFLALLAAAANGVRLAGWYTPRLWSVPLLWVLHLGYAWMIAAWLLWTLAGLGLLPLVLAQHAFTTGALGGLTLGMMARVALGHTGRPLEPHRITSLAFVVIYVAAATRVLVPWIHPAGYTLALSTAALLWSAAFGLFLFVYTPVLLRPRADGRPG